MTLAICIKCGGEKFGALVPCNACGFRPTSEEELAKSMIVSDHYLAPGALHQISNDLSSGKQVEFSSANVVQLVGVIRKQHLRRMIGLEPPAEPFKKPWWRLF